MLSPKRHHAKQHRDTGAPFEACQVCARDKAVCRSKIRFSSWQDVREWVDEYNESHHYEGALLVRYRCRWCEGWHMKTAKHPRDLARVERYRRKWMIEQAEGS